MAATQFEQKRRLEKRVCKVSMAFMDLPPSTTQAGHREYIDVTRKLEEYANDPAFRREFIQHYSGFVDFLKQYDLNVKDLEQFLGMDIRLLVRKIN